MSDPTASQRRPGASRPLWITVLLLVVAAALLWGSSSMTWQWSTHVSDFKGTVVDAVDGAKTEAGLVPLAIVCLAAIAATIATGGFVRRIVGVLVGLAGVGAFWLGLHTVTDVFGNRQPGYPLAGILAAHGIAALAGACAVAAAVLVFVNARGMPRMGSKYQTPAAARAKRAIRKDPDAVLWDELSEGKDPTER